MIIEAKIPAHGVTVTLYRQAVGGTVYAYFTVNGARFRPSLKTKDLDAARAAVKDHVEQSFNLPANRAKEKRGFTQLVEDYLSDRWPAAPVNDLTFRDHRSRLRNFAKHEGSILLARLTFEQAVTLTQRIIKRRTNGRTATNDREVLRAFWKWLRQQDIVTWASDRNPAASELITIPPTEEPEPDPLCDEDARKLLDGAVRHPVYPLVLLCLGAGCRPSEACRVTWDDIDFQAGLVNVVNRKGKKRRPRQPPLSSWVMAGLQRVQRRGARPYVYTRDTAFDHMAELCEMIGVRATLQQCRQTACTKAILSGMELVDYVTIFGHSLEVARRHYWKLGQLKSKGAMEAVKF